jgi:putative Mn2+ efflux pump MntP
MAKILTLLLLGLSVGLGNFAASVAIGLSGVDKGLRTRIAIVFGLFETGMPIIGLLLGHQIANSLGGHANLIGSLLLVAAGIYVIASALEKKDKPKVRPNPANKFGKLMISGLALSIDNLIIGFSLGTHHESILLASVIIGVSSVVLSLIGLEIGSRLSSKVEGRSEKISGIILILVGIGIATNIL